jgi:hypothetical protein
VIDDFCKQLVARHPASISRWLLGLTGAADSGGEQGQPPRLRRIGGCSTANSAAIPSTPIR